MIKLAGSLRYFIKLCVSKIRNLKDIKLTFSWSNDSSSLAYAPCGGNDETIILRLNNNKSMENRHHIVLASQLYYSM